MAKPYVRRTKFGGAIRRRLQEFMPSIFTLMLRLDDDAWEGMEARATCETHAIEDAQRALEAVIELRSAVGLAPTHATAGVGRGAKTDQPGGVVWLGKWEWTAQDGWNWQSHNFTVQ